jgi:hypothetical protein
MSNEPEPMKFVVKGTTPSRDVVCLTAPDSNGCRYLGPPSTAEQFDQKSDAQNAIAALPRPFRDAGFFFWVEVLPTDAMKKKLHEILVRHLGEDRASEIEKMMLDEL